MDAPIEQPRGDNNNNNENGSDPEQSETLLMVEAARPFFGLLTKKAISADLASIDGSLTRLREDVEQRVTLEDSKKVEEKIERLTDDAEADRSLVSHVQKAVDTKAASADLDCVGNTLKMQQIELQSVKDSQKQFATFEALKHLHDEQASCDADLKKRVETVEQSVSTMQDKEKQFATSKEVQTLTDIQHKAREDGLEELKKFMLDKIEESDQSLREVALKAEIDPLIARLGAVEGNLERTTKFLTAKKGLVEQITTMECSLKSKTYEIHDRVGTVETILETSTAGYTELKRKIDGMVNQMDNERKERANLEEEVRNLRQDLKTAEITRQKDKDEFEEVVKDLRQEREAEKRAHTETATQLVKTAHELESIGAGIAAVKGIQDTLVAKIVEEMSSKLAFYMASNNEYITAQLLKFTEITKEDVTRQTAAQNGVLKEDLSRYCKDLQEESERVAEKQFEDVRKDFENCTSKLEIRLTEYRDAFNRHGKDVNKYVHIIDPISADINTLKKELVNHHKSLKDEIQEHSVQAKVYTDQSMRKVDLNSISRERSVRDCIDPVKTVQVGVLETQMDESKAQQERLTAEQTRFREELDAQKKQHDTLKTRVEEGRKEADERHYKLAVKVHNHDAFLRKMPAYM